MTLFQFWAVAAFVIGCIVVTYLNTRQMIVVRKQRDKLATALLNLYNNVNWTYPEGLHKEDESMLEAKQALAAVVRAEKE